MELLSLNQRCKKGLRLQELKQEREKDIRTKQDSVTQVRFQPFCIHSHEKGQTWIDHFNGKKKQAI
jgi:hypothetical protein